MLLAALLCTLAVASSLPYLEVELQLRSAERCQLRIDGEAHGELNPDSVTVVSLPPGEVLIECESLQGEERRFADFLLPAAVPDGSLQLSLRAQPPQPATPAAGRTGRFSPLADGVLDADLGAVWANSASAAHSWPGALANCASLGGGWQLPSVIHLRSLAGQDLWSAHAGDLLWSNKAAGADSAYAIDIRNGSWSAEARHRRHGAWCLRLP